MEDEASGSGSGTGVRQSATPPSDGVADPVDPADDGPIRVLLVDDNTDWLSMQAELLRRRDDRLVIETVTDPRDVSDALAGIDCVVSDYDMHPLDGLELLERVREAHPTLPFVLTTGRGGESVASRAIAAGVTDYVVKDPGTDLTAVLATRIVRAVTKRRAERRLAESRRRFVELFEAIPDPVAIADTSGRIVSANPAFERVFGTRTKLPEPVLDAPTGERCEFECDTATGREVFLYRGARLTGSDLSCHTFTAITARAEREAERALELETREAVRDGLLSASTREGLERVFCERLAAVRDYPLVWIGDRDGDGPPDVRAAAGPARDSLDALCASPDDPGVSALEEDEPVVATDLKCSGRGAATAPVSGCAVQIEREALTFGIVAAYSTDADGFDEHERNLLSDLADLLAHAIDFVTKQRALFSGERVAVTLTAPAASYPVANLFDGPIEIEGTVPHEDGTVQHVVTVPEPVDVDTATVSGIQSVRRVGGDDETARLGVVLSRPTVDSLLAESGGRIESVDCRDDRVAVVASYSAHDDVQEAVQTVLDGFPGASVTSYRTVDRLDEDRTVDPTAELTDRQREVLTTAYRGGYFERPKRTNSEELAATLDISRSTFLQHLRTAQRKLFSSVFDTPR